MFTIHVLDLNNFFLLQWLFENLGHLANFGLSLTEHIMLKRWVFCA